MRNKLAVLAVAVGLFMVSVPMFAHHSTTMYDKEHPVTLEGIVTEFRFINPHMQIQFEVKDEDGDVVMWVGTTGAPARRLNRMHGWTPQTVKPGDVIMVTGSPLKDGDKSILIDELVGPDGLEYTSPRTEPEPSPPR